MLIKTAQELKDFSRGEESQLEDQIKAIAATGAKVRGRGTSGCTCPVHPLGAVYFGLEHRVG